MLDRSGAIKLVKDRLFPIWEGQRENLDRIDCWYRWQHESIDLPRGATAELKRLATLSKTPWLSLVVTAAAQAMYVDGYRSRLDDTSVDANGRRGPRGPRGHRGHRLPAVEGLAGQRHGPPADRAAPGDAGLRARVHHGAAGL
jgi:hypothetical protein